MKPLRGVGASPAHLVAEAEPVGETSTGEPLAKVPAAADPAFSDGLVGKLKHALHDLRHPPAAIESPSYLQVEGTIHQTLAQPQKLTPDALRALVLPLATLEPAKLRALNELLFPKLMPWDRADSGTLVTALAERAGLPQSIADEVTASVAAHHHDVRRVDGPVQLTLDRVLKGERLTPSEFGTWLQGFLALPATDRRHIAKQLFVHLGLHPAKQEEVAREVAVRAGLPPSLADGVKHYQAGQDLTFVASVAYRFGLPLVSVGVSAGLGGMIREKNLVTGEHKPTVVAPEGVSAGVIQLRAVESIENGHVTSRFGAIGTSPFAIGIGAGHDPIFGPVVSARFGPLTNFFVGQGAVGARVPLVGGFISGTGVALSIAAKEPRLEAMTEKVVEKVHLLEADLHELTQFVKRIFHGNDKAVVLGLADEASH